MVRGRVRSHLEALKERFPELLGQTEVQESAGTDYAFRLFVPKSAWMQVLAGLAEETDYDNFKSEVAEHLGKKGADYEHSLHDVWAVMKQLQTQITRETFRQEKREVVPSASSSTRMKPIESTSAMHEIIASVGQLQFMKQHSETMLETLVKRLELTHAKAPNGRIARGQTYELCRGEKADPLVRERLLEKMIWAKWRFRTIAEHQHPFFGDICRFIQSYQVPLQGTRADKGWGKIDLVGVTSDQLPVVIELKQENAKDTPLRMLAEALAYACAVRKAWANGCFRREWETAIPTNKLEVTLPRKLETLPILLLAPSEFWLRSIGSHGQRTNGKVEDDAWGPFMKLVDKCKTLGYPVHFVKFDTEEVGEQGAITVCNVMRVQLPGIRGT